MPKLINTTVVIMMVMLGPISLLSSTSSTAYWAGVTFAFGFVIRLVFLLRVKADTLY